MSWSYQDWKQDDNIFYGYITPSKSAEYDQFDIDEVFFSHKIDSQFYGYPHTVYGVAPSFDVNKVYHYFECNDAFYGYPAALGITFNPLGAFMNCSSLTSVNIPESVYEFGAHSFYRSGIDSITISPDSIFYNTTFPEDCTISYYPATTNVSSKIPGVLEFYCFDDEKVKSIASDNDLEITINNKTTRPIREDMIKIDVDEVKTDAQAYIVGSSSNIQLGSFEYSTKIFNIFDGTFEQGGIDSSGNPTSDMSSIRSVGMFPSIGGLYRFIGSFIDAQSYNLVNPDDTVIGYQNNDGTIHVPSSSNEITTDFIPCTGTIYAIISGSSSGGINYVEYDENKSALRFWGGNFSPNRTITITPQNSSCAYIRISWTNGAQQPICVTTTQVSKFVPYIVHVPPESLTLKVYRYTTQGNFISSSLLTNPVTLSNLNDDINIGGATYMVRLVLTYTNGAIVPQNVQTAKLAKRSMFNFLYYKDSNSNDSQNNLSSTASVICYDPCKLVLAVLHRPDVTLSDNEFTFLYTSTLPDTTRNQRISIWTKDVQAGKHSVTVTPSNSTLIYQVELLCLYDVNSITVADDKIMPTSSYTVPAKTNPCRRLYISSSTYAPSSGGNAAISISNANAKSYTMNNDNFLSNGSGKAQNRYATLYDYDESNASVPTFSSAISYTADSINVVTLDIT